MRQPLLYNRRAEMEGIMYREELMKPKKNKVAGLYPICKLKILGMYVILIILANIVQFRELPLLLIPLSFCIPLLFAVSGQFRDYFSFIKVVSYFVCFVFLIQVLLIKGSDPILLWQWGIIHIYLGGLDKGLTLAFNILNFAGIFYWLFRTSTYQEISSAMEQNGLNHKAAYVFLSTFKMIDVMRMNVYTIMDAQRARGVETEGNVFVRAKAFVPIIIPLVVTAMLEVGERALTLESKAFSVQCKKTIMIPATHNGYETKALIISAVIVLCAIGGTILWLTR